jgi:hypothetical protein
MNTNRDSSLDDSEDDLREVMALLQRVEPTLETRVKNRQAIAAALAGIERSVPAQSVPWWRQSISLPVPAALGFCTLLLASALAWLPRPTAVPADSAAIPTSAARSHAAADTTTPSGRSIREVEQTIDTVASETYLCGIGRISHEMVYRFQE